MSAADVGGGGLGEEKKDVSRKRCPKIALTFKAAHIVKESKYYTSGEERIDHRFLILSKTGRINTERIFQFQMNAITNATIGFDRL